MWLVQAYNLGHQSVHDILELSDGAGHITANVWEDIQEYAGGCRVAAK